MITLDKKTKQKIDDFFKKVEVDDIINYIENKYGGNILYDIDLTYSDSYTKAHKSFRSEDKSSSLAEDDISISSSSLSQLPEAA